MYISNVLFMRIIWKYKDFFIIFALYMSRYKSITLLGAYDQDLERFLHRVGKDRGERALRAMKQGRQYVAAFLQDWMQVGDIELSKLVPQFINDFSIYLSTDRGLHGGTIWLACQLLKGGSHQSSCPWPHQVEPLQSVPHF